jgi:lactoylglutathione lyase
MTVAGPAQVHGLFETHLTVSELERSVAFYRDAVGLSLALEVPERGAAFFWVGAPGRSLLGLWSLGTSPLGLTLHLAFEVGLDDLLEAPEQLEAQGITPLSFFGEETAEPSVISWIPAAAVYFRDPDGHQLEYLTMLEEKPRPDLGIVPWSEWPSAREGTLGRSLGRGRLTVPGSRIRACATRPRDRPSGACASSRKTSLGSRVLWRGSGARRMCPATSPHLCARGPPARLAIALRGLDGEMRR